MQVEVPYAETIPTDCYLQSHVRIVLTGQQRTALRHVLDGCIAEEVTLASGKAVATVGDAVKAMIEIVATAAAE